MSNYNSYINEQCLDSQCKIPGMKTIEPLKVCCNDFDRNKFSVREGFTKLYEDEKIKLAVKWLINEDVKIKKKISKLLTNIDLGITLKISALLQQLTINKEKAFEDVMKND